MAPHVQALCGFVGNMVMLQDFADRAPRVLTDDEVLPIGRHRLRYLATPHVPPTSRRDGLVASAHADKTSKHGKSEEEPFHARVVIVKRIVAALGARPGTGARRPLVGAGPPAVPR